MTLTARIVRFAVACLVLTLAACGGGGGDGAVGGGTGGGGTPPAGTVVGAAGGTVLGPNGVKVEIPPGALATDTTIAIEATTAGSPALPGSFSALGQMFALTPHGTTFAVPVTVTLPFDPASVLAGQSPSLFKTNAQNQWEQVAGATFATTTVTAQISSFSWVQVNGLLRNDPVRDWSFGLFRGDGSFETELIGDTQTNGELEVFAAFGPIALNDAPITGLSTSIPADGKANGHVFSTADGVTYGVYAEAPFARAGGAAAIGGISRLTQKQSFIKLRDDAFLNFTVTHVTIEATEFKDVGKGGDLQGEVFLSVGAAKTETSPYFFLKMGRASLSAVNGFFTPSAEDEAFTLSHLWSREQDFNTSTEFVTLDGVGCVGVKSRLELKRPLPHSVDLSSVLVGEEFTLEIETFAKAIDRKGGGSLGDCQASTVNAFLRDPQETGGTALAFGGLAPTNRPTSMPPVQQLVAPAACVPGPGPNADAGVLQFSAASYTVGEFAGALPTTTVTRTGGSRGAVTATFTTGDGTASAGTDYSAVNATVFFADGDAAPKVVNVPIVQDQIDEVEKTVNLSLSQPGGCAALGTQATAVLTIRDDSAPSPPPRFTIGGTVTGLGGAQVTLVLQLPTTGESLSVGDGRFTFTPLAASGNSYSVRVATKPTNTVCTVRNGTGTVANASIVDVGVDCVAAVANGLPAGRRSPGNS